MDIEKRLYTCPDRKGLYEIDYDWLKENEPFLWDDLTEASIMSDKFRDLVWEAETRLENMTYSKEFHETTLLIYQNQYELAKRDAEILSLKAKVIELIRKHNLTEEID